MKKSLLGFLVLVLVGLAVFVFLNRNRLLDNYSSTGVDFSLCRVFKKDNSSVFCGKYLEGNSDNGVRTLYMTGILQEAHEENGLVMAIFYTYKPGTYEPVKLNVFFGSAKDSNDSIVFDYAKDNDWSQGVSESVLVTPSRVVKDFKTAKPVILQFSAVANTYDWNAKKTPKNAAAIDRNLPYFQYNAIFLDEIKAGNAHTDNTLISRQIILPAK